MSHPADPWAVHEDERKLADLGPAVRPLDAAQAEALRRTAKPYVQRAGQRGLLVGLAVGAVLLCILLWALGFGEHP